MSEFNRREPDQLEAVFGRTRTSALIFYSGCIDGVVDIPIKPGRGYLHLVEKGGVSVRSRHEGQVVFRGPTAILLPRPNEHQLVSEDEGANVVCAEIDFGGDHNPFQVALPDILHVELNMGGLLHDALGLLFHEARVGGIGSQLILDRVAEIALLYVIRHALAVPTDYVGFLGGLSHSTLSKALIKVHADPAANWTLERMAEEAGLSRSVFAATFREVVGQTPGEYLQLLRLHIARASLSEGKPLKQVAGEVGYNSYAALSRALAKRIGSGARRLVRGDR